MGWIYEIGLFNIQKHSFFLVLYLINIYFKAELPQLEDLLFVGNPLEEKHTAEGDWRKQVATRIKNFKLIVTKWCCKYKYICY